MKKGFTLIELLIVMVVVGVLVTVSLPKYRASMERGRAMEAIANLRAASDFVNAQYVMDGNTYVKNNITDGGDTFRGGDFTKSSYFKTPSWYTGTSSAVVVYTARDTGDYELYAVNKDGDLKYIACSGDYDSCLNIGMEEASFTDSYSNSNLIMNFQ